MDDVKILFCKLCFTIIKDKNYELIEDDTKDILVVLLLELDSPDDSKHVMCSVCSTKLFAALKFKLRCLYTDEAIKPYIDDTTILPLDLKEIYKKERASKHLSDDIKICRLCMQPVKDVSKVKAIKEEEVDMLQKFVPEMNIFMIREPVTCNPCMDALAVHYNFLKKCSDVEQNIGDNSNEQIPDAPSPVPSVGFDVKMENVKFEENICPLIKTESMDINYEEIKSECEIKGEEMSTKEPVACSNQETHRITSSNKHQITKHEENTTSHMNQYKIAVKDRMTIQEAFLTPQMYQSETSSYETKNSKYFTSNILIHKDPSEVQKYKCATCCYQTRHKHNLKKHMVNHKDPSQVQIYKCEFCNYETRHMRNLKIHILIHKGPSEVPIYKCETCNYQFKLKARLKRHMLIHKDPSEVQMYQCETCNYKARDKYLFEKHRLKHKDPSEMQKYKCEICNCQIKRKCDLKRHMLIHEDPSGVQMYKRPRQKRSDIVIRKNHSQMQVYICETCNYETRNKTNLKTHMLIHKDPSDVQMYKCETCNYQSKRKADLGRHMLIHQWRLVYKSCRATAPVDNTKNIAI